jgi:hypothetical protein
LRKRLYLLYDQQDGWQTACKRLLPLSYLRRMLKCKFNNTIKAMLVSEIKRQIKSNTVSTKTKSEKSSSFDKLVEADAKSDITSVSSGHALSSPILWSFPDQEQITYDYGSNILDDLNLLHKKLVLGEELSETLKKLKQLTNKDFPIAQSSELNNIIREIRVRAAVELAKRAN